MHEQVISPVNLPGKTKGGRVFRLDCGQDREGPLPEEGKLLSGRAQQVGMGGRGRPANRSQASRMRQPNRGPGRPREFGER